MSARLKSQTSSRDEFGISEYYKRSLNDKATLEDRRAIINMQFKEAKSQLKPPTYRETETNTTKDSRYKCSTYRTDPDPLFAHREIRAAGGYAVQAP